MDRSIAFLALVALFPGPGLATCLLPAYGSTHPEKNAVLATVASAEVIGAPATLRHGATIEVRYRLLEMVQLRGQPRNDLFVYSLHTYNDPSESVYYEDGESVSVRPGETLLIAFGDSPRVLVGACTTSRVWHGSIQGLREEWSRKPSNNSFKVTPDGAPHLNR